MGGGDSENGRDVPISRVTIALSAAVGCLVTLVIGAFTIGSTYSSLSLGLAIVDKRTSSLEAGKEMRDAKVAEILERVHGIETKQELMLELMRGQK